MGQSDERLKPIEFDLRQMPIFVVRVKIPLAFFYHAASGHEVPVGGDDL
jgi:hypothetical protein